MSTTPEVELVATGLSRKQSRRVEALKAAAEVAGSRTMFGASTASRSIVDLIEVAMYIEQGLYPMSVDLTQDEG